MAEARKPNLPRLITLFIAFIGCDVSTPIGSSVTVPSGCTIRRLVRAPASYIHSEYVGKGVILFRLSFPWPAGHSAPCVGAASRSRSSNRSET